ncbi:SUN domain-containing protein 4-like isoform X1 [Syzygium oleosum]|uniref:SUN domain-containing protein 4-like isoform X1 n=1 Tax=Syzygium oleosum TaxID=219896 RepID=UPI0024BAAF58|nr:SUN domain-containing protein 4-like isoform X1 [Syzygium oleosum]
MQRSVEAFLRRKDAHCYSLQRKALNKLSLFLLVPFWWLVFASGTDINLGNALGGLDTSEIPDGKVCLPEFGPGLLMTFSLVPESHCAVICHDFRGKSAHCEGVGSNVLDSQIESKQEHRNFAATSEEQIEVKNSGVQDGLGKDARKGDRVARDEPPKFDEFKHKAIAPREKTMGGQTGSIMHRVEPGGAEYDYASASKGAKVLAFNKEAKGASNILGKDMDKYLLNPCSAEEKFVIIELSEETLVYTVEIANFEHHSSNVKDFLVLGSLVYPAKTWVNLGQFTAKNVKQSQRFRLSEPKWVRYLKLDLLSHYGSEFYCTLSTVRVYGVDAVERMLEDLISVQDDIFTSDESGDEKSIFSQPVPSQTDGDHQNQFTESASGAAHKDSKQKLDVSKSNSDDQISDIQPQPVGRLPGDSVLKILMQKVRSLDINLSILERYLEELNFKYGDLFKEVDEEIAENTLLLEKIRLDITDLLDNKGAIVKDLSDLVLWKSLVSTQIDILNSENAILRSEMETILDTQEHMENKGILVLLLTLICGFLSAIKLIVDLTVNMFSGKQKFVMFPHSRSSWIFLLLYCALVGIILLL